MSFFPRDNRERSRRPSGANGGGAGGCGFGGRKILAGGGGFDVAGLVAANVSAAGESADALAARCFFRSGFVCLATLSHNAHSSSLKARLRRGEAGNSGIGSEGGRFIGRRDSESRGGATHEPV
jgi:hypothetical protein